MKACPVSGIFLSSGAAVQEIETPDLSVNFESASLRVPLYGALWIADATKESLLACCLTVIERTGLSIQSHTRVEAITKVEAFAGPLMLVVGGGESAVESAPGLANQKGTTVALSYRGAEFGRIKDRTREKIAAAVAAKHVELLLASQVKEIRCDVVVLEHNGAERLLPTDGVAVRIGGEAPYPILERIGVRIVKQEMAVDLQAPGKHG